MPGHKLALAIEAATCGVVSKEELRPDIWSPEPKTYENSNTKQLVGQDVTL